MTFKKLKSKIIEDEREFIIEMYEDVKEDPKEAIHDMVSEIECSQTPSELINYYTSRGFKEAEAYETLLSYLIKK